MLIGLCRLLNCITKEGNVVKMKKLLKRKNVWWIKTLKTFSLLCSPPVGFHPQDHSTVPSRKKTGQPNKTYWTKKYVIDVHCRSVEYTGRGIKKQPPKKNSISRKRCNLNSWNLHHIILRNSAVFSENFFPIIHMKQKLQPVSYTHLTLPTILRV